jgi:hypothetical protein
MSAFLSPILPTPIKSQGTNKKVMNVGVSSSVPVKKPDNSSEEIFASTQKAPPQSAGAGNVLPNSLAPVVPYKKPTTRRSRELRLEQNRKAARESRRRKKVMMAELQKSLILFSKANAALKQHNEDLTRRILLAHSEVAKLGKPVPSLDPSLAVGPSMSKNAGTTASNTVSQVSSAEHSQVPVSQAHQGVTPVASTTPTSDVAFSQQRLTNMQPGATMQTMANFQQAAAAAAMQAAGWGIQSLDVQVSVDGPKNTDTISGTSDPSANETAWSSVGETQWV